MKSARLFLAAVCAAIALSVGGTSLCHATARSGGQAQETNAQSTVVRRIGTIKAIKGTSITLALDSGNDVIVTAQSTTRILRVAPGAENVKNATPIQLQEVQVGDRILAAGTVSNGALTALTILVMKHSDLEAQHEEERGDWQKRGIGGLVSAVDPATGTVTISVAGFGGIKSVAVHTTKGAVIRRYATNSVKFDEAKPSTLAEIRVGDQLRARGERSADGGDFSAVEIVSGTFRNIAGMVSSVDPDTSSVSIQDLLSKKTVIVNISPDSQLRQLPPEMAERIGMRMKRATAAALGGGSAEETAKAEETQAQQRAASGAVEPGEHRMGGGRAPDFQRLLNRLPALTLAELRKGDAVLVVSTPGTTSSKGTVVTLVSGVEPLLRAAPSAGQVMMLAPWSLGAPGEGGEQ
ncbi:MAG TPA: hypothetical protein VMU61_14650 [Candidatus Aquilonibacter sp.]|nr:hypothetical protein [Candidatus Aquilonibacter sp.]